ncbi:prepilin-type N-terminal cleavage/methylation domain-containing protein [Vibrio vulnificus]|uniref:prepilin-type N-terminal cleavage/methylation domain-containing protein n=1 Tax=Vibrio vulnificus TaxID=672 RepID=UPI000D3E4BEA|nr:prepilin-type N-terminal cleavage/methylation domain-containing protein [Vibrio vulnificus]EGR0788898.1 prepilin-type N-terminal cleavage/methylation domain-containing protein [Vibrio vulnificus]EGR0798301.1 prepilin-type N-terminal cleavage/methylation domain-containing protein [Vibrio vulnificus]EGR0815431.1 prepilin-type N-terminal cleavage/methylation domain-containing protein [Vibrio vulnificus]EGR0827794.1 prepilin-type N-terminal cleavage/methylation domain-containing protein [Vibrio 
MIKRAQAGFTLVELIVVIILISIVSAYAASRYIGTGSFSAYAAQEQAISIIRQLQVYRMQSNTTNSANPNFELTASGGCLGSTAGCTAASTPQAAESRSEVMRLDGVSVSSTISPIRFDLRGNPLQTNGSALNSVTITFTASGESASVCINSQGYVSGGGC